MVLRASVLESSAVPAALYQADACFRAGQWAQAEEIYRRILHAEPLHAVALNELGRCLQNQGKLAEAAAAFRRLIALQPDLALAHKNLGVVLCRDGRLEESFAAFRQHAALAYKPPQDREAPHKTRHDVEQRAYLADLGVETASGLPFHLAEAQRVAGGAIHAHDSTAGITAQGNGSAAKILVLDRFLTDAALDGLRRYCLASTIWRQVYADGYLGAFPQDGLGSPLLAQIADDLRGAYPAVFGQHPLLQFWGFKYDSALGGIALHADFAAINVNFWITPDDANLDPAHGGLIVWDKPAPLDWDFARYNDNAAAARDFLTQSGARAVTIPYRANRAVIFDSSLFHETDTIRFKPGYLNRRINITLLYGKREKAGQPTTTPAP